MRFVIGAVFVPMNTGFMASPTNRKGYSHPDSRAPDTSRPAIREAGGITQDQATPFAWAQALAKYINGSHLITVQGEGHTGFGRESSCVDNAVDTFLTTGEMNFEALECKP